MENLSRLRLVALLEGGDLRLAFEHALYLLKLAQGFLEESRQDVQLQRWRSAVDNSQLAVENSAKAVLSLAVPVGKTHNPAPQLREALSKGHFQEKIDPALHRSCSRTTCITFQPTRHFYQDTRAAAGAVEPVAEKDEV